MAGIRTDTTDVTDVTDITDKPETERC